MVRTALKVQTPNSSWQICPKALLQPQNLLILSAEAILSCLSQSSNKRFCCANSPKVVQDVLSVERHSHLFTAKWKDCVTKKFLFCSCFAFAEKLTEPDSLFCYPINLQKQKKKAQWRFCNINAQFRFALRTGHKQKTYSNHKDFGCSEFLYVSKPLSVCVCVWSLMRAQ